MNVKDLMSLGGNLTVSVNLEELRTWHDELTASNETERHTIAKPPIQEELLTRKEVLKILGVDASTLWRWAKTGYLLPFDFGGQKRYRASDIRALVEGKRTADNCRRKEKQND
jgi:predicted DNA-binding transcriptional regulator AlpA